MTDVARRRYMFLAIPLLLFSGCGRTVLTADDMVYLPGRDTIFVAQVEEESPFLVRDGVENESVAFWLDGKTVGQARTDGEGRAQLVRRVDVSPEVTRYTARIQTATQTLRVDRPIHRWDPDKVIIVVDVDHTLSRTDFETLLTEPIDTKSEPYEGARQVLATLAERYELLYLTARPRFLLDKTRQWLGGHDFPDAPLVTTRSVGALLEQAEKKRDMLQRRKELWPNLLIGIGDKNTDIEAYAATGMLSVVLAPAEVPPGTPNVVMFADWSAIGRFFERHAATLQNPKNLRGVIDRDAGTELVIPNSESDR